MKNSKQSIALRKYWKEIKTISKNENISISQAKQTYRKNREVLSKKNYRVPIKDNVVRYLNFEIAGTQGYVGGYIATSVKLTPSQMKKLLMNNIPRSYYTTKNFPTNMKYAEEKGHVSKSELIMFRENSIFYRSLIFP